MEIRIIRLLLWIKFCIDHFIVWRGVQSWWKRCGWWRVRRVDLIYNHIRIVNRGGVIRHLVDWRSYLMVTLMRRDLNISWSYRLMSLRHDDNWCYRKRMWIMLVSGFEYLTRREISFPPNSIILLLDTYLSRWHLIPYFYREIEGDSFSQFMVVFKPFRHCFTYRQQKPHRVQTTKKMNMAKTSKNESEKRTQSEIIIWIYF